MSKTLWMGVLSLFAVAAFIGMGTSVLRAADSDGQFDTLTTCGCVNKGNCQVQADCGCGCNGGGGCGR